MKLTVFFTFLILSFSFTAHSQWTNSGNNYTSGNLSIGQDYSSSPEKLIISATGSQRAVGLFGATGSGQTGIYFDASNGDWVGGDYGSLLQMDDLSLELNNYGPNPIYFRTNQTTRMTVLGNGNVGIGTGSPGHKLQLYGSGEQSISITSTDASSRLYFRKHDAARDGMIVYHEDGRMGFHLDNSGGGGLQENEFLTIRNTGAVGIGTSTPSDVLEVNGNISNTKTNYTKIQLATHDWSGSHGLLFNAYKNITASGNLETPGNTSYANNQGNYSGGAGAIMFFGNGGTMDFLISPASGSSGQDTGINWGTPKMRITRAGEVGIGTKDVDGYRLSVGGTIRAEEIKVEATPWPDYVFEEDYDLRSLEETEAYIQENRHLPEIPSAKEMEANGVALGEMNRLLLQKIEELTLHIIEQEKRIQKLENKSK